jgi:hypothetical protein
MIGFPKCPEIVIPPIKYSIGEIRYIKIQKPNRAIGVLYTQANKIIIVNKIITIRPANIISDKGITTIYTNIPIRI